MLLKTGTKTPQEVNIGSLFTKLRDINKPMYDELLNDYKAAMMSIK